MFGVLICCLSLLPDILSVDDDGPADFDEIARAVAASKPYDTVTVAPGTYAPFAIDHPLSILAEEGFIPPQVQGTCRVEGTGDVALAGLDFTRLHLLQNTGPVVVRACTAGGWADPGEIAPLVIEGCRGVILSSTYIQGSTHDDNIPTPSAAWISSSVVAMTNCSVTGAQGASPGFGSQGEHGGTGLTIRAGSHVQLAATGAFGGNGGEGLIPFSESNGTGGTGVSVSQSELVACGTGLHSFAPGGFFVDPVHPTPHPGYALILSQASARVSGVKLNNGLGALVGTGSTLEQPTTPDPFVLVVDVAPGSSAVTARFYGPPGADLLAGVGPVAQPHGLPHTLGALWFEPHNPLSMFLGVTTAGQTVGVAVQIPRTAIGTKGSPSAVQILTGPGSPPLVLVPDAFVAK